MKNGEKKNGMTEAERVVHSLSVKCCDGKIARAIKQAEMKAKESSFEQEQEQRRKLSEAEEIYPGDFSAIILAYSYTKPPEKQTFVGLVRYALSHCVWEQSKMEALASELHTKAKWLV